MPGRRVVDQDQVEIGGEGHLAAAEPAHADDRERAARAPARAAARTRPRPRAAARRARSRRCRRSALPASLAVERAAQQLHADLEAPLAGPAPQQVERVLAKSAAPASTIGEIGGEPGAVGRRREKSVGQHRVEQRRALRQLLGQKRRLGHDIGDQRQQAGIRLKQREQLHARRQARQELVEAPQRRVGMRRWRRRRAAIRAPARSGSRAPAGCAWRACGHDASRAPARATAAGSAKPSRASVAQRVGIVLGAGEDEVAGHRQARRLLEQLGVMALDRAQMRGQIGGKGIARRAIAEKGGEACDARRASDGRRWVCWSSTICRRCSTRRRKR